MAVFSWHTQSMNLKLSEAGFPKPLTYLVLTISFTKTKVMCQLAQGSTATPSCRNKDSTQLKSVSHFKYLGSVISSDGTLNGGGGLNQQASQLLCHLFSCVMNHRNIKLTAKIKVYRAVVLTSLLYGCQTWSPYRKHIKQLEHSQVRS